MKHKIDLATWNRNEHFEFFNSFEEPFFGLTTQLDCENAYHKAKTLGVPFSTYYLHKTLVAVNENKPFRLRIENNEVVEFSKIHGSPTVLRDDKTFGFSQINFDPDLVFFTQNAALEVARVKQTTGLFTREFSPNVIHFSVLPWISFTSFSHARSYTLPDSCPKMSFGKMTINTAGKRSIPFSVHVHHGLVDGYDVGVFVNRLQDLLNEK
ncbi:MAG: chloramphenicol acetyltransferase [Flavobacterium sp.]|nr:chloramphenicol acetyltransferase [Flavobacterium sp.]